MEQEPAGRAPAPRRRRFGARTALAIAVLAIVGMAVYLFVMPYLPSLRAMDISADSFAAFMREAGAWGVVGSIALMIIHSFIPFPAEFVAFANGLVYGPYWGVVITWVGAMLGALIAFGLARWLGRPFVESVVPAARRDRLDRWAARSGWQAVFFSRFFPVISFNLVNYAAGLTSVGWVAFVCATGIGILPATVLMVVLGHNMYAVSWQAWVALAAGGVFLWAVLHWSMRRHHRRQRRNDEQPNT